MSITVYFCQFRTGSTWLFPVPWGLRNMLKWIKKEYNNTPVYITENGVSDKNGTLQDQHRIEFYNNYINNVLKGKAIDIEVDRYQLATYLIKEYFIYLLSRLRIIL